MRIILTKEQQLQYYNNIAIENSIKMLLDDIYLLDLEIEDIENNLIHNYENLKNSLISGYNELNGGNYGKED
jgi:hypothetical protein